MTFVLSVPIPIPFPIPIPMPRFQCRGLEIVRLNSNLLSNIKTLFLHEFISHSFTSLFIVKNGQIYWNRSYRFSPDENILSSIFRKRLGLNLRITDSICKNPLSSLIKIEKVLNRPITKFYNTDDVNVIAAELRLTETRPTYFYKKHNLLLETVSTDVNKVLKTKCKNRCVCMAYCKLNCAKVY